MPAVEAPLMLFELQWLVPAWESYWKKAIPNCPPEIVFEETTLFR